MQAWEAGLTWVFVQSFVLMVGGFVAPVDPQDHAARGLARLAGRHLDHLHLDEPGRADVHDAGDRLGLLRGDPGQLVRRRALFRRRAGRAGRHRGRHGHRLGIERVRARLRRPERRRADGTRFAISASPSRSRRSAMSSPASNISASSWSPPSRSASMIWSKPWTMSRAPPPPAIRFPTTRVLTADGVISLIGCLMGNPFINAVYIGHPGWKAMGGRIGYSGGDRHYRARPDLVRHHRGDAGRHPGRRDPADPALHRHADRLAGVPGIAASGMRRRSSWRWCRRSPPGARRRSTTRSAPPAPMPPQSATPSWRRSACSTRGSRRWAAARRWPASSSARSPCSSSTGEFEKAAAFALAGAVFDLLRLHSRRGDRRRQSPTVAVGYLGVAAMLFAFARYAHIAPATPHPEHGHGELSAQPAE